MPDREKFLERLAELRPELHRYCARLTGSVFDGEDVVQNTFVRACRAFDEAEEVRELRPWLFRIAHNRALDFLRARERRMTAPLESAADLADESLPDPAEALARKEATATAISRFILLPPVPRSVVILKDVLDHSLADIAALLELSLAAVKSALHRGRVQLRELNAAVAPPLDPPPRASAEIRRYVSLFNARDWAPLRALLAEDVRLDVVSRIVLAGKADVGQYFGRYDAYHDWHFAVAFLEGREVIAVFSDLDEQKPSHRIEPSYLIAMDWRDGRIQQIKDFRYARYLDTAGLVIAGTTATENRPANIPKT